MQAVLLFVLTIVAAAVEPAQVVTGVVIDGKSQKPLFGAVVAAPDGKRLAVSDRAGRFRFAGPKVSAEEMEAIFRGGGQALPATVVLGSQPANVVLTFERLTRP